MAYYPRKRYTTRRRRTPVRRTYARKNTGPRYYAPKSSTTRGASAQLRVHRDPFAMATSNPKIPDGKTSLSAGQTFQSIQDHLCPPDQDMMYILYPGLGSGLVVADTKDNSQDQVIHYPDHGGLAFKSNTSIEPLEETKDITQWRIVSQGLQLSLLNNAEQNEGWFETVRLTVTRDPKWFCLSRRGPRSTAGYNPLRDLPFDDVQPTYVAPVWGTLDNGQDPATNIGIGKIPFFGIDTENWVNNSTYRSGKLRDIHKHKFMLGAESNDHDFIRLDKSYTNTTPLRFAGTSLLETTAETTQRLVDQQLDHTMDILVVKIHGRGVAGSESKILSHLVTHQELCYENGSRLARFHSETYDVKRSKSWSGKTYNSFHRP